MNLEEAIKHCEEVAEENEKLAEFDTDYYAISELERGRCRECAKDYRQLADWLRELKARRRIDKLDHIIRKTAQYQMPEDLDQMRNEIKELEKYVEGLQND